MTFARLHLLQRDERNIIPRTRNGSIDVTKRPYRRTLLPAHQIEAYSLALEMVAVESGREMTWVRGSLVSTVGVEVILVCVIRSLLVLFLIVF